MMPRESTGRRHLTGSFKLGTVQSEKMILGKISGGGIYRKLRMCPLYEKMSDALHDSTMSTLMITRNTARFSW